MPDPHDPLYVDLSDALDDREEQARIEAHDALAKAHETAEIIPDIESSDRFTKAYGSGLHFLGIALEEQTRKAVESMERVSPAMGKQARKIVARLAEVGQKVSNREISPESGELAIKQYLHAVQLYGHAIENKEKVEAYVRGMRLLETSKRALFVLLRMGLQAAAPSAGPVLSSLAAVVSK